MKIKIGPITASYKGTVKIQEADEAAHRVAMRAQAKDARGQGTAAATITSTMEEVADGTKVHVVTDMRITGPAASFGRGVMQDVSAKLMGRFADCLAEEMRSDGAAPPTTGEAEAPEAAATRAARRPRRRHEVEDTGVAGASSGVSSADGRDKDPERLVRHVLAAVEPPRPTDDVLDLGEASRDAVLKRALPLVGGVVALLVLLRLIRR